MNGGYVDYSTVTYNVATISEGRLVSVAESITKLSCTDTSTVLSNEGEQAMHQYYIVPASNGLDQYGDNATALYISGENYRMPFRESFKNSKPTNFWAITGTEGEGWRIGDDWSYESQDGDNGLLAYNPAQPDVVTTAMSGKIDMKNTKNPTLTFYMAKYDIADNGFYDTDPSEDVINIQVGVDGFTLKTVETIELKDVAADGRYRFYMVSLDDLGAKDFVVIAFENQAISARTPVMIDNITVKDMADYNVIAGAVTAPEAVEAMTDLEVSVNVSNGGSNAMENITVRLMHDGVVETETTVSSLDPDQEENVILTALAVPSWGEEAEFTVEVVADKDEIPGDNVSAPFNVKVLYHSMPPVSDLTGTVDGKDVNLEWTAPEGLVETETKVTETFDSYSHGDLSFGQWKSEDKSFWGFDGVKEITVDGVKLEIPNSDDAQAFMIFNPVQAGIDLDDNPEWEPISGDNVIVCFGDAANEDMEPNNDWLFSPELSGKQQTISFYARTAAKKGKPDDIKVLYANEMEFNATGTVKTSTFKALENGDITLTREWVKYEFTLPAGAKYFAIRNISEDGFAVLIDNISYEPYVEKEFANLIGYNVYHDGELLSSLSASETNYTVKNAKDDDYTVTAAYDEGESVQSNVVTINIAGISEIGADDNDAVYYDLNGLPVKNPLPGHIYIRGKRKQVYRP